MATSTPPTQAFTADINIPPSPVPHLLLHGNVPPSEYESTLIRSAILDSQSSLSQLESRLTAVLREFRRKRKALRRYSQVHQRVLSRKPHIPPEILSSIFTLCLPSDWKNCHVYARAIPVLLSQVSVYWRHVALSTPRLWSSMDIWLETDVSDRTVNMFETWLARTHGTLLSIKVSSVDEQTVTHPILELILSCSHRWQHFAFSLPISLTRSLSTVKGKLPCLESLSPHYYYSRPEQLNSFQNAPRLTDLNLGPHRTFSNLTVPWTQLTKLQADMDLDDVIEILYHSPNLVHLCVSPSDQKPGTTRSLVQLPHLATLVIDTEEGPTGLFNCLVVPHLRNLDVWLHSFEDADRSSTTWWDWLGPLLSLIFTSSCSIQSFTFRTLAVRVDEDDLTRCLQAMPALRDLTLQLDDDSADDDFAGNFLHGLIHRSAEPRIIPKLMYLDLRLCLVPSEHKTLIFMIESRWRMVDHGGDRVSDKHTLDVARLQVVILRGIYICPKRHSEMLVRLRKLKDEGMRIELWDSWSEPVTF